MEFFLLKELYIEILLINFLNIFVVVAVVIKFNNVKNLNLEWLQLIALATREHSSHRPVLIITETVQNAEEIINHLKLEGISQNKIRSYMRDFDEVEKHFEASPASSGDIVVATNKGGRGTDIKVSKINY